jgi:hypothetical protein
MKESRKPFFNLLKDKKFWFILAVGLLLRAVLMVITLHSDLWAVVFSQYLAVFKGVTNIYDYLGTLGPSSPIVQNYGRNFFTYPPLAYFTFGLFGLILRVFYNADFMSNLAATLPTVLSDDRLFWHLFWFKFPYLIFDLGVLWLLTKLFGDGEKKWLVFILWLFNPLAFYTSFMIGQFDIIPVFWVLLSLMLVKQKKINWAAFCLGVGGAYKMFPLFFLPFLAVNEGKNLWQKGKLFLIGLAPYLTTILPFLGSASFRQNVLFSNQSQKILFAKINVSGAEYLSLFVVFYVGLLLLTNFKKMVLWKWFLMVMLVLFSLTHYHPQWFLWLSPLLVIFWAEYPDKRIYPLIFFWSWFLITLFFEPSLSISLFAPISPSLKEVTSLADLANRFFDAFLLKSLIRSVFAGAALAISWPLVSGHEKK